MNPLAQLEEFRSISTTDRGDRGKGNVSTVGGPVHPAEFVDIGCSGGDSVSGPEIFVLGEGGGVDFAAAGDFAELGVDDGEFVGADVGRAVGHAVVGPGVVAYRGGGGGGVDYFGGDGATAGEEV